MSECYYDEAGCLICPEQAAQPYIPARIEKRPVLAWNAGANSITTRDGGMRVKFTQPLGVIGAIIGFKSGRTHQTVPGLVEHGWYFQNVGGVDLVQPIESGKVLGMPIAGRTAETLFEIRRVDGVVRYVMDGVVVRVSDVSSIGHKVVNCCLFASGDSAAGGSGGGGGGGTTSLLHESVSFSGGGTSWTTDQSWSVEVPEGATKVSFVLTPPSGNPADAALVVNFGSRPTGEYGVDTTVWSGFTYEGAAVDGVPNAGPVDFTLDFDSPAAGTWYIVVDSTNAGSGYTLDATLTT